MWTWISNIFSFVIALACETGRLAKKFVGKWWYSHY